MAVLPASRAIIIIIIIIIFIAPNWQHVITQNTYNIHS